MVAGAVVELVEMEVEAATRTAATQAAGSAAAAMAVVAVEMEAAGTAMVVVEMEMEAALRANSWLSPSVEGNADIRDLAWVLGSATQGTAPQPRTRGCELVPSTGSTSLVIRVGL